LETGPFVARPPTHEEKKEEKRERGKEEKREKEKTFFLFTGSKITV
jgi:hypothetical protein